MHCAQAQEAVLKNHEGKGVVNSKLLPVTSGKRLRGGIGKQQDSRKTTVVTISLLPLLPHHSSPALLTVPASGSKLKTDHLGSQLTMDDNHASSSFTVDQIIQQLSRFTAEQRSLAWSPSRPSEPGQATVAGRKLRPRLQPWNRAHDGPRPPSLPSRTEEASTMRPQTVAPWVLAGLSSSVGASRAHNWPYSALWRRLQ